MKCEKLILICSTFKLLLGEFVQNISKTTKIQDKLLNKHKNDHFLTRVENLLESTKAISKLFNKIC